ncbi:MAG: peptidoglycan bridge formation glycyltransferase FemA/FemB family protein [Candidatus Yanofskybacteria bacterium]|nr:peptidoglycan bridge formation glycyltransferase FemA/FemB family protein [Candidatus Yanofskybacteria bacterium]
MKSFLQTTEWLKFQESIGHKTWRFDDGKIRANIIQHKVRFGKNYLYIPHGPEILFDNLSGGLKNEVDNFLKYLKELAKENGSIFVKFEPLADVIVELVFRRGIKRSKKYIQPQKTVILNLNLSEEELLSRMHYKTRYNIKVAERNRIRVEDSSDLDAFWELLKNTTKRDRFSSHNKEYYRKLLALNNNAFKVDLVSAHYNNDLVAGAIILCYGDTAYYLHGASDHNRRQLMAPYALHWEIIKALKGSNSKPEKSRGGPRVTSTGFEIRNSKFYDMWGIDSRKWPGVTRFKLGWGGQRVEHPGSFDIPISRFWYFAYNLARKIF